MFYQSKKMELDPNLTRKYLQVFSIFKSEGYSCIPSEGRMEKYLKTICLTAFILIAIFPVRIYPQKPERQGNPQGDARKKETPGLMDPKKAGQTEQGSREKKPSDQGQPEGRAMGMPPAIVVVDDVTSGMIAPESEFIGTVFFDEVSQVASEMDGIALSVGFQEGEKVKQGQELVRLDSELLHQTLLVTQASYDQAQASLEKAELDFSRTRRLFEEKTVPLQKYDDDRYNVIFLEKSLNLLKAEMASVEAQLKKKILYSPFDGWVIEKMTERGEWVSKGGIVASIAREGTMDIRVYVPETVLPFIKPDMKLRTVVNGKEYVGIILSIIPRGSMETRTFPMRIHVQDPLNLMEGMEARVRLPIGEKKKSLMVLRDAVIEKFGQNVIYIVENNTAVMMPVTIVGYEGKMAGVEAGGIREGTKAIVKGNERLQSGQQVAIAGAR